MYICGNNCHMGDNKAILGTPYLCFCKAVFAQIDYLMHLER